MKTRDRILQASLQLFNERGERAVTTNHIAAELGISPGNLYYHFRNKTEIITELLEQYQHDILELLIVPTDRPLTTTDKLAYFHALSSQFWRFRFLHRDIHHLIEMSDDLRKRYPIFSRQVMQRGKKIYEGFVAADLMRATPAEIEALIINVWIVLTNWSNFLFMSGHLSRADNMDERWLRQGLRQMVFLEGPYLTAEGRVIYDQLLDTYGEANWFDD
ncbi:MAG: TetR/AcrR family transcriptional regulator [Pseudomonadota bacterium]|nr:TetR/AcrR family transcriptional regulator [Pseudomonadota bacterium]